MTERTRKKVSSQTKADALQRHILKKVPVSEICQELGVQPSAFYLWQKELFARAPELFDKKPGKKRNEGAEKKVQLLEEKLARRDEALAELMQEHIALKKSNGGL